jgi:hypothetical protein
VKVPRPPVATYRLQFHAGFTFEDARQLVPYLYDLGISHIYASPYLRARSGSTHGYDVVDPTRLNAELGGEVHESSAERRGRHRVRPRVHETVSQLVRAAGSQTDLGTFQPDSLATMARASSLVRRSLKMPSVKAEDKGRARRGCRPG